MDSLTVVLNRKAPSRIHVRTGLDQKTQLDTYHTIKLKPGANLLSKQADIQAWTKAQELAVVARMIEAGSLEIKDAPKENKSYAKGRPVKDLSELKLADAMLAIEDCKDKNTLKRWAHQDGRETVQKAIYARAEAINPVKNENEPS